MGKSDFSLEQRVNLQKLVGYLVAESFVPEKFGVISAAVGLDGPLAKAATEAVNRCKLRQSEILNDYPELTEVWEWIQDKLRARLMEDPALREVVLASLRAEDAYMTLTFIINGGAPEILISAQRERLESDRQDLKFKQEFLTGEALVPWLEVESVLFEPLD